MLKSRIACGLFSILCFHLANAQAGQPVPSAPHERRVELFTAAAAGEIDVELTAPSPREVWLRVANKTNEQLKIDLPNAFAAVPVLGQIAPGNLGAGNGLGLPGLAGGNNFGAGGNLGNFAGGNAPAGLGQGGIGQGGQGLGGGFNNGGNGVGNLGGGNVGGGNLFGNGAGNAAQFRQGMFRVPAGRVGKIRAETVCLEHGKPDPNSRMRYRIVPIEDFNADPRITRICHLLASRQISQSVAQAAAWHIANGLTWEELAAKERLRSRYTGSQKFFTSDELQRAARITESLEPIAVPAATTSESSAAQTSASETSNRSNRLTSTEPLSGK